MVDPGVLIKRAQFLLLRSSHARFEGLQTTHSRPIRLRLGLVFSLSDLRACVASAQRLGLIRSTVGRRTRADDARLQCLGPPFFPFGSYIRTPVSVPCRNAFPSLMACGIYCILVCTESNTAGEDADREARLPLIPL
jgi:hypothetical protein